MFNTECTKLSLSSYSCKLSQYFKGHLESMSGCSVKDCDLFFYITVLALRSLIEVPISPTTYLYMQFMLSVFVHYSLTHVF